MTLTLATAKHAVGKYGEISDIVDDVNDLTHRSVTREAAIEATELGYQFTPCIVVTTAREALEAAWELAHEPEDGIIPAMSMHIRRNREGRRLFVSLSSTDVGATDSYSERRLLDPPELTPEPEPWEQSRYCRANGEIFKRIRGYDGPCWQRPGSEIRYYRDYLVGLSPKPVTIEGETE